MEILTKSLSSLTYDDIVTFSKEKNPEGIQLDYKKEFPDKGLAKIIASFANTRGGIIIIGIEEDEKTGIPINADGLLQGKHEDRIYQYIGNITPIPKVECFTTNEKGGRVFVLIRVYEGIETPYYVYNDNNIWIRTGNVSKQIDIVSPEGNNLLFKKRERAEIWRIDNCNSANTNYEAFLKKAEKERIKEREIELENYEIKKKQHEDPDSISPFRSQIVGENLGSSVSMLKIIIQPFFQQEGFVRPLDIEPIIYESRSRNTIYEFPGLNNFESISEGMISFGWVRSDGEITCQQIFANGLVFSANDILRPSKNGPATHLGWFTGELYITLLGMKKIIEKFGYRGSIIGEISVENIEGVIISPITGTMWLGEEKTSAFNRRSWQIILDTQILFDEDKLKSYVTEITRDIHWSFGYKDIQKKITTDYLVKEGYLKEN